MLRLLLVGEALVPDVSLRETVRFDPSPATPMFIEKGAAELEILWNERSFAPRTLKLVVSTRFVLLGTPN